MSQLDTKTRTTFIARHAERFARVVDRRELLKRGLIAATSLALLDRVAIARGADGEPILAPDGTPLTYPDIAASPACCCCSTACYNVACEGSTCGCELGCCFQPAHSGNPCQKRFNYHSYPRYCWTCFSGSTKYVCCDYYCCGTSCICARNCANQGNCGSCN